MRHPIKVRAIMAHGEGFTYRIEDAKGACFNINEGCLCSSSSGHETHMNLRARSVLYLADGTSINTICTANTKLARSENIACNGFRWE
jgi:hypothetical protein